MRSEREMRRMRRIQLRVAHLGGLAKLRNIMEYGAESQRKFPSGGNLRMAGERVARFVQVTAAGGTEGLAGPR